MAWSTIRKATPNDTEAIAAAARRFCQRHGIEPIDLDYEMGLDCALNPGRGCSHEAEDEAKRLRPLWRRIVQRVLGKGAEGIAHGYIGFHVD